MASTSQKGLPVEIGRSQLPTFPACEDQVQAGRKKQSSAAHRAEGGPCRQTPGAPVLLYDTVRCDFGQGAHPLPVSTSSPAKWVNDRTSTRKVPEKTEEPLPGASSVQVAPSIAAVSFQVSAIDPVTCDLCRMGPSFLLSLLVPRGPRVCLFQGEDPQAQTSAFSYAHDKAGRGRWAQGG